MNINTLIEHLRANEFSICNYDSNDENAYMYVKCMRDDNTYTIDYDDNTHYQMCIVDNDNIITLYETSSHDTMCDFIASYSHNDRCACVHCIERAIVDCER